MIARNTVTGSPATNGRVICGLQTMDEWQLADRVKFEQWKQLEEQTTDLAHVFLHKGTGIHPRRDSPLNPGFAPPKRHARFFCKTTGQGPKHTPGLSKRQPPGLAVPVSHPYTFGLRQVGTGVEAPSRGTELGSTALGAVE